VPTPGNRIAILLGAAVLCVAVSSVDADLPADDWPQSRRDAARTGRTPEPGLATAALQWLVDVGGSLTGEPVVAGCQVFVTSAEGEVVALNAHDGSIEWSAPFGYQIVPTRAASALAFDDSQRLLAGQPADPAIVRLWSTMRTLDTAVRSYMVDNGFPPGGPDLAPDLVPVFLSAMPQNPILSGPVTYQPTFSVGDYRYEQTSLSTYGLAMWFKNGDLIGGLSSCAAGLPPSWPVSAEQGGLARAIEPATGAPTWQFVAEDPATDVVPGIEPGGVLWSSAENGTGWPWVNGLPLHGKLRATDLDGALRWQVRTWSPLRGGAARDPSTGALFVSRGRSQVAGYLNSSMRNLMTAIESYQVDNGVPPQTEDLRPHLAPTFIDCMPHHPYENREVVYAPVPAPGDYDYMYDTTLDTYQVLYWDEDGNPAVIAADGSIVQPAVEVVPAVVSYDAGGGERWRAPIGGPGNNELSPPAIRSDGSVVIGTRAGEVVALEAATGAERWRTLVGGVLLASPAVLAADEVVVLTEAGEVVLLEADGSERWRRSTGSVAQAAPVVTGDGTIYAPGADGTLRAYADDGRWLWDLPLGGPLRAGLSTAAIQADGWLFVGRTDGVLVAVADAIGRGRPPDLGNILRAHRQGSDVMFSWQNNPQAAAYNVRRSDDPRSPVDAPIVAHVPPDPARDVGGVPAAPDAAYYRLYGLEPCAELQGP